MRGVGRAVTVLALAAALTGCGEGGGGRATDGEAATASATAARAEGELTVAQVRRDVRAAFEAAGQGRVRFADMAEAGKLTGNPCKVVGFLRTAEPLDREAVRPVLTVLEERGWRSDWQPPSEDDAVGWYLRKNRWDGFLGAGDSPEGPAMVVNLVGTACGVPLPTPPAASETAPPGLPTPPALTH
ncbi:hypothetical protein [Streptomyces broussonetiae]|uniref:Lipoprotein n=1 Tax=Streptomyces broussonetiae TaxID=2686304 RepID=A0ABV5EAJ6_9ACTN